MAKSTITGYWRFYGGNKNATPAVLNAALKLSFDPTQATAATGVILPKGAIPLAVRGMSGSTGGTNPTIDVGISGNGDGFADNLVSDAVTGETVTGVLLGIELTVDTEIFAGVGASAATGGTTTVIVQYIMADDGSA